MNHSVTAQSINRAALDCDDAYDAAKQAELDDYAEYCRSVNETARTCEAIFGDPSGFMPPISFKEWQAQQATALELRIEAMREQEEAWAKADEEAESDDSRYDYANQERWKR